MENWRRWKNRNRSGNWKEVKIVKATRWEGTGTEGENRTKRDDFWTPDVCPRCHKELFLSCQCGHGQFRVSSIRDTFEPRGRDDDDDRRYDEKDDEDRRHDEKDSGWQGGDRRRQDEWQGQGGGDRRQGGDRRREDGDMRKSDRHEEEQGAGNEQQKHQKGDGDWVQKVQRRQGEQQQQEGEGADEQQDTEWRLEERQERRAGKEER